MREGKNRGRKRVKAADDIKRVRYTKKIKYRKRNVPGTVRDNTDVGIGRETME